MDDFGMSERSNSYKVGGGLAQGGRVHALPQKKVNKEEEDPEEGGFDDEYTELKQTGTDEVGCGKLCGGGIEEEQEGDLDVPFAG